jgi:hypothetical protein
MGEMTCAQSSSCWYEVLICATAGACELSGGLRMSELWHALVSQYEGYPRSEHVLLQSAANLHRRILLSTATVPAGLVVPPLQVGPQEERGGEGGA